MSLGAKFVEVEGAADASSAGGYAVEQTEEYKQKQQQRIAESVAKSDIISPQHKFLEKSSDFNYRRNAQFYEKWLCNYRFSCFYWW